MAGLIRDEQEDVEKGNSTNNANNLKHFCKICKKGFGCGRALGGHMRAHGIGGDDSTTSPPTTNDDDDDDDDDPSTSDWDNNQQTYKSNIIVDPTATINRRMYPLRTNPNRLKTCRICHNCGKEFFSWKSFLEHGKCTDEDLDSSDENDAAEVSVFNNNNNSNINTNCNNNWSKRKRSLRLKVGSPAYSNEDEDLANCLMMLSNGVVERMFRVENEEEEEEVEESSNSATKDHHNHHHNTIRKPINFIPPLSYRLPDHHHLHLHQDKPIKIATAPKGMFECKACKKVFNSHQALGGHRASHKKVKGCFAARLDHMDLDPRDHNDDVFHEDSFFLTKPNNNNNNNITSNVFQYENGLGGSSITQGASSSSKRKAKVHECSICHRIFSSGQALGGHKRCHWITSNNNTNAAPARAHFDSSSNSPLVQLPLDLKLDLNLIAPPDEVRAPPAFDVSTDIYLQSWVSKNEKQHQKLESSGNKEMVVKNEEDQNSCSKNKNNSCIITANGNNVDQDEGDSKVKLAKFSELKDINMNGGNSSPWLQVGIGSTADSNS